MKIKTKNKYKQLYRNILKHLPTKIVLNIENLRGYHKFINFKKPKFFGEKIQYLKVYGNLEKYSRYVDKYKVREYIKKKIGEEYLIPLLGVYDNPQDIEYNKLPDKFVIKLNTGSGYNIIVDNKRKIDKQLIEKKLNKWMKEDYYKIKKELQYKNIPKKILIEQYIQDKNHELQDYKFYCFNGEIKFIEVDFDRFSNHTMNFYDNEWNLLDLNKGDYKNYESHFPKPLNYEKMLEIVKKIANDFQFARIDFYNIDGVIYFGEITLTPAGGLTPFKPIEKDIEYANLIDIKIDKNILYVGRVAEKRNILDGVTVKAKVLKQELEISNNIEVVDVDNWKKDFLRIIVNLLNNYKKSNIIVICSSSPGASIILRYLYFIKSKKRIYYFVSGGSLGKKIKEKRYPIKIYKNIYKIYVESDIMKKEFNEIGLFQTEVIYNFRKPKIEFKNINKTSSAIKFVFYGRIIKDKGIEEAIELIRKLSKNKYNVILDIYGQVDNDYLKSLDIEKDNNINYKGVLNPNGENEYKCLHKYDIFIFPTKHEGEGLPGSLIDSYIAGLAVIASNWKYANEYIENNRNGIIFEYKNYNDMFNKTEELIKDPELIDEFKKESLRLSKKYIIDYVIPKELVGDKNE